MTRDLESQAKAIERWKADKGIVGRDYVPANGGARRTPEKRALLATLTEEAAKRGRKPPFSAKF